MDHGSSNSSYDHVRRLALRIRPCPVTVHTQRNLRLFGSGSNSHVLGGAQENPFQQAGSHVKDRQGPNFVTDYVPVPVRTLRNHTPAHVFWVLHPNPDTDFRDGMSSWAGIVFLRTTFSGRIS